MEKISLYFILFLIYSFLGWLMEVINSLIKEKKFVNRGFLLGPYCPIYGYSSIIMIFYLDKYKEDILTVFLLAVVVCSIVEYLVSLIMEKLFNARWWDYSNRRFNINGRVCLIFSLMFGIIGLAFAEWIYKPSNKLINKIRQKMPTKFIWLILIALFIVLNVDTVFSIIRYI